MTDDRPTKLRLAERLEGIGESSLAQRARLGEFDDFESPHAMPKMALLTALNLHSITNRRCLKVMREVRDGLWDNTKAESDAWAASPDGQRAFHDLLSGK